MRRVLHQNIRTSSLSIISTEIDSLVFAQGKQILQTQ